MAQPSRLLDFLRRKEEEIQQQKNEVASLLPALESEYELQKVKQEAHVFEGLEGLKNVREEALKNMKKGDCIYFFGVPSSAYTNMQPYYAQWNERRVKKGIKSYTVFTAEAKSHPYVEKKLHQEKTYSRFLPKNSPTYAWTEIYGDTVVIAINYKKALSIVIHNKYVAQSYRTYFDLLWQISTT